MASDRDLKTLSRQRMTCSAGDGAPAQRFSADERLRAAPLEPREGLSQAKTLLPLGRSVSKKRTMSQRKTESSVGSDPRPHCKACQRELRGKVVEEQWSPRHVTATHDAPPPTS